MLVYWLDIIGTAVFAISGVLLAGKLRMDPFGVLVLGVVTAVGGGTIRDMALANGPVFWVKDPTDLVVAMVTSMLTILLVRQPRRLPKWILPVLDAVGLALFVGIGGDRRRRWDYSRRAGAGNSYDSAYRNLRHRLYRRRYCPRHGTRHLSSLAGEFGNDGDGGHPGNSSGGYSLASEAADVCPGR